MISECIFNIFIYFDDGIARYYGVRHHRIDGNDYDKTTYLQNMIDEDHLLAKRFTLTRTFTPEQWMAAQRVGNIIGYFEEALVLYHASISPIICVTSVIGGTPKVDFTTDMNPYRGDHVSAQLGRGAVPDYLISYIDDQKFRLTELIDDDYFKAIRTLFNAKLYVSCTKLLMSCTDTLAFVEFGDVQSNFIKWVDTYVDLRPHGINSNELWEFRNSLLHMTNLFSRKVTLGKVSPIMPYVGGPSTLPLLTKGKPKPFNLHGLITSIGDGIGRWAKSYNDEPEKFLSFVERYDLTVSDNRIASFYFDGSAHAEAAEEHL